MLPLPKFHNVDEMAQGIVAFLKFMENPEEILRKQKSASQKSNYKELSEIVEEMRK
ncbi:MAG: hypothetical protein ACOYL6_10960 [Bacteriovoracaceae bacterium]